MERKEKDLMIIEKANFYKSNEAKAHVKKIGMGNYIDGLFVSKLEHGEFFWFIPLSTSMPIRLFLYEIHDIGDYVEVGK